MKFKQKAFTLVEIMVALMIFSMVVVVALAALVRIIDANKKAQLVHDSISQLSFSMDSMSRELRTGSVYFCRPLSLGSVTAGSDMSDILSSLSNAISVKDVGQCTSLIGDSGDGFGVAFLSNRTVSCPQTNDKLITAYQIVPIVDASGWTGTFSFEKAFQKTCGGSLDFVQIISPDTYEISNYYTQIYDATYPLFHLFVNGKAVSYRELGKSEFDMQIVASPRVP